MYLIERQLLRKRTHLSTGSLPKWLQWPGLSQACQKPVIPSIRISFKGGRVPRTWTVFLCFLKALNRELDWKAGQPGHKWSSARVPTWQVAA